MTLTVEDILKLAEEKRKPGKLHGDHYDYVVTSPKMLDPKTNPCIVEQHYVKKCMYEQNNNSSACEDAFQNHIECGDFWTKVKFKRMFSGKQPYLPLPEDREEIKRKHIEDTKKQIEDTKNVTKKIKDLKKDENGIFR